MTFAEFHNALRVLLNIDADEFLGAVLPDEEYDGRQPDLKSAAWRLWDEFKENPHRWFIRAPDDQAQAIWKIIEGRTR